MAEDNTAMVTQIEQHRTPNPLENLLSMFQNFKLLLPQPKKQSNSELVLVKEEPKPEEPRTQKPGVVRFPERRKLPEPIKLHEEDPEATTEQKSPALMWQIYAVGAYVVARWAWNQWQKKNLKNPSDDDEQNDD